MGYIQDSIISLGKEKGFVTSGDVQKFYAQDKIYFEMRKLVLMGYFEKPEDKITFVKWKYMK